jgi:hypothetical protein
MLCIALPAAARARAMAGSLVSYEIWVGGRLGDTICSAFPDLRARASGDDTVLSGVFADQAALYGVLAQLEGWPRADRGPSLAAGLTMGGGVQSLRLPPAGRSRQSSSETRTPYLPAAARIRFQAWSRSWSVTPST